MGTYLSLIIPTFNEEQRIGKSLASAIEYFEKQDYSYEIIVVDDGSKDKTETEVGKFPTSVLFLNQKQNFGKGAAIRRGMLEASGEIRIFSDADFSTPIYEVPKLIEKINSGADICIGSRALDYSMIKKHQPFYREFMGKTFNKFVQAMFFKGIKDTQCGFKGFKAEAAEKVFSLAKINGFSFDVELLYIARIFNLKVEQVSVEWYNDNRSKVNPIFDSLKMIFELLKIKRLHKDIYSGK